MKNYKIIMLGPSGSGKTVFLASMYKKLAIYGDPKFFLEVKSGKNRKRLNSLYMKIATGETWPRGNRRSEISEWSFICKVQTPNLDIYPACQFTYIDYAGGLITDEMEDEEYDITSSQLDDEIEKADTFLGLLDGQKILEMMNGSKGGDILIYQDLPNMLPILSQSENPVHFVISKWDLLENKYSLEEIRNRLFLIKDFLRLVRAKNTKESQVRLIPVSSVGSNFVIPQPDGSMKKRLDNQPEPFQVEMPLACVLTSRFQLELKNYKDKVEQLEEKKKKGIEIKPNYTVWDNVRMLIADSIETVWDFMPENYKFGDKIFQRLIDFAEEEPRKKQKEAEKRTENLRQELEQTIKSVKDEETALDHVVASFLHIESILDTRFPSSNIKL